MSDAVLRPVTAADHAALREICLGTGTDGLDASGIEDDPNLVGQIFAVPYAVYPAGIAYALKTPRGVRGYLLGVPDTAAFETWLHETWFPPLRPGLRDPGPDATTYRGSDWARRHIHVPPPLVHPALAGFPAHGHIDLLPDVQGQGHGKRLMEVLMNDLRRAGAQGMHLDVSPRNTRAIGFYETLGFRPVPVPTAPDSLYLARSLVS